MSFEINFRKLLRSFHCDQGKWSQSFSGDSLATACESYTKRFRRRQRVDYRFNQQHSSYRSILLCFDLANASLVFSNEIFVREGECRAHLREGDKDQPPQKRCLLSKAKLPRERDRQDPIALLTSYVGECWVMGVMWEIIRRRRLELVKSKISHDHDGAHLI